MLNYLGKKNVLKHKTVLEHPNLMSTISQSLRLLVIDNGLLLMDNRIIACSRMPELLIHC